ncbi:MAG: PilT/PilU family type 4a pilus ATPase [Pyrinomonadaceae bacterium]
MLTTMVEAGDRVSDLFISPGNPPLIETSGQLTSVKINGLESLTATHTAGIAKILIGQNKQAREDLEKNGSADISYSVPGLARFRVNVFMQRGTHAVVLRVVTEKPPTFEDLKLPEHLKEIAELKNGIVLVTGATGSGKSSTLAAVIDLINEIKKYHIITVEDPIEFIHQHKNSAVHQRELHSDTTSFASALRAALRQAPKVILVGEMRDRETVETALEAAETGHLVLSTLHTVNASKTVNRIIGIFPKNEEQSIRMRLAHSFRYIISQRLLPRADGKGRIAALEILKSTSRTREYIEKGESEGKSITDAMEDGATEGMQTFDGVLENMIREGVITVSQGLVYATNANNLQLRISDLSKSPKPIVEEEPNTDINGSMLDEIELNG